MSTLPAAVAERVAKRLGMIGSDHEGEIVAAARAAVRELKASGLGIADLCEHVASQPREVVVYRDRPAPQPAPKSYGDWRSTWHDRYSPGVRHRARIRFCGMNGARLSPWEASFIESLGSRLDRGLDLTPKQESTLAGIWSRLGGGA